MNTPSRPLLSVLFVAVVAFVCVAGTGSPVGQRLTHRGLKSVTEPTTTAAASTANQAEGAFQEFQSALSAAMVMQVNEAANVSWSAGMNEYFDERSYQFLKQSCGTKIDLDKVGTPGTATSAPTWYEDPSVIPAPQPAMAAFPTEYDARQQWGEKCPSLYDIRDQAGCGSCWAVAAASSMTDRHCIASGGARKPYLSALNILTCCGAEQCGSCQGGYPIYAWQFWANTGVVTGGSYGSADTCQPYEWPPCEHHTNGTRPMCTAQNDTPKCSDTCSHGLDFAADKHYGTSAYKVSYSEWSIMSEIYFNGPVEAGFMVYEDFPHYKSGVYEHVKGKMLGGHAVKLVGWGVEGDKKYWLAANSWNTNWGDNGFFKIAKGKNECMIEDMIFAGQVR